jgi:putative restriction endonuclease
MKFHGKTVRGPVHPDYLPKQSYIKWHVAEVFKGQVRYIV